MSDNLEELDVEQIPNKRGLVKKIILLAVVVLLVCAVVAVSVFSGGFHLDSLRRWVKYMNVDEETNGVYSFDAHSSNRYASFDGGLALASVSGLSTFDESGAERFLIQQQMNLPQLQVAGDMAMAYDVGGNTLVALHKRSGEVLHLEEARPILDADLSSGGYICTSSSASGYKSVLSVYNADQDLIYRWLSSTTYIPNCAISPDGRTMAAIGLGQSDGVFESSLLFFRTDAEELQTTVSLGSDLIYDVMFLDGNTVCAVGETGVQYVSMKGELLGMCSYEDRYLKDFDAGGDGFLTLSVNMYRAGNRYSLLTIDKQGQKIAELYIGQEILDLSACGRYLAVLTT